VTRQGHAAHDGRRTGGGPGRPGVGGLPTMSTALRGRVVAPRVNARCPCCAAGVPGEGAFRGAIPEPSVALGIV
jgi:hypothetical protein